ncbi:MAG: oxidoreductase [Ferruginibacter sp.]
MMLLQQRIFLLTLAIFISLHCLLAQKVKLLSTGTNTSIRGLSVVNDRVIWVSGSNGMVGRSIDSGASFRWASVKGFEKADFRDIEAFDEHSAVIMAIATPAYILRTDDGGINWKIVYENHYEGMFLDAMDFFNNKDGIVIGDPIEGKFFMARSLDAGRSWKDLSVNDLPIADSGEACFASSGTNIRMLNKKEAVFVSGGLQSNIFTQYKKSLLPVIQGKESTGANSIAVKNRQIYIVAGGDFSSRDSINNNCFITRDAGKTWRPPVISPHGYRSCVEYLKQDIWISCGLNGVDLSEDEGNRWKLISDESFHVCRKAKKGEAVFMAGGGGRIGKLLLQ